MDRTPAGALERKEQDMSPDELVGRFEKVAIRDLDIGNAWSELSRDIEGALSELTEGPNRTGAAERIVERHQSWLKDEKGLDDTASQVAYILAIAKEIKHRKGRAH